MYLNLTHYLSRIQSVGAFRLASFNTKYYNISYIRCDYTRSGVSLMNAPYRNNSFENMVKQITLTIKHTKYIARHYSCSSATNSSTSIKPVQLARTFPIQNGLKKDDIWIVIYFYKSLRFSDVRESREEFSLNWTHQLQLQLQVCVAAVCLTVGSKTLQRGQKEGLTVRQQI
jgi:hypothetical protein